MKKKRTNRTAQRRESQAIKRIAKRQRSVALETHYLQSIKTHDSQFIRTSFQYDEHSQKEEVGALIAKYHDYIDRGIIKPRSFIDNYDQASWMSSILTEPEMKKILKQADKWMEMSAKKRAQRLANEPTIDF